MFGRKPQLKEGTQIFSIKKNGEFNDFIFGVVTGVDGRKVGINGVIVNPIGLKNKIAQGNIHVTRWPNSGSTAPPSNGNTIHTESEPDTGPIVGGRGVHKPGQAG